MGRTFKASFATTTQETIFDNEKAIIQRGSEKTVGHRVIKRGKTENANFLGDQRPIHRSV